MLTKIGSSLLALCMFINILDAQTFNRGCSVPPAAGVTICGDNCTKVKTSVNRSLGQTYLNQPLYVNFGTQSGEGPVVDNICYTFFPLVGSNKSYILYISTVTVDGENQVKSYITTQDAVGTFRTVSPDCSTFNDTVIGLDQCDTDILYRCYSCDGCGDRTMKDVEVAYGLSGDYGPIPAACLQQCVEVIQANGVPPQQYMALPMRLPPLCVTRQSCVNHPSPSTCCDTGTSL